tara:strand:- start:1362 stop:1859 length:498 start_codon:yes stop_codon:yes gene_type:complete
MKVIYLETINSVKRITKKLNLSENLNFNHTFEITSLLLFCIFFGSKKSSEFENLDLKNNQILMDYFIRDIDHSLRLSGIGDMSIGKYVKTYVKKFYYRVSELEILFSKKENINHNKFNEYLIKYNVIFNSSDLNYVDNLINDLKILIERSKKQKINQYLYRDLFN